MSAKKSLIDFPCHFPIKIIGKNTADFAEQIAQIIARHFPDTPNTAIRSKKSQQGAYLSITVTIYVHDQLSLNAFYQELSKHPEMKMVL